MRYIYKYRDNFVFSDINECVGHTICQNGATCVDIVNGFTCTCVNGFTGVFCQSSKYCKESHNAYMPYSNDKSGINNIGQRRVKFKTFFLST